MAYKARKRKVKKNIPEGQAHIHSTFNNTIVTITDKDGNAVSWASSGTSGFKGSKKKTPFAAGMSAEAAGKAAYDSGMRKVDVFVRGLGSGRETAIRSLQTAGLEILSITDVTPVPHNGCRPYSKLLNMQKAETMENLKSNLQKEDLVQHLETHLEE